MPARVLGDVGVEVGRDQPEVGGRELPFERVAFRVAQRSRAARGAPARARRPSARGGRGSTAPASRPARGTRPGRTRRRGTARAPAARAAPAAGPRRTCSTTASVTWAGRALVDSRRGFRPTVVNLAQRGAQRTEDSDARTDHHRHAQRLRGRPARQSEGSGDHRAAAEVARACARRGLGRRLLERRPPAGRPGDARLGRARDGRDARCGGDPAARATRRRDRLAQAPLRRLRGHRARRAARGAWRRRGRDRRAAHAHLRSALLV